MISVFRNVNRLFVLPFKNGGDSPTRNFLDVYNMFLVEIKDFNALIDNKPIFDQSVKNKQKAYEKLNEISINNHYATGNLVAYFYHQKFDKPIGINLSRQTTTSFILV